MGISPTKLAAFSANLWRLRDVVIYTVISLQNKYKGIFGGLDCRNIKSSFGVRLLFYSALFGSKFLPRLVALFRPKKHHAASLLTFVSLTINITIVKKRCVCFFPSVMDTKNVGMVVG